MIKILYKNSTYNYKHYNNNNKKNKNTKKNTNI